MKFIKCYQESETIHCLPGSRRITGGIKEIVEQQMRTDDETTVMQLHRLLNDNGYSISLRLYFSVWFLLVGPFMAAHTVSSSVQ